jgi:hypothetical protein
MIKIGIEEILLEYHKATDKDWNYIVKPVTEFPEDAFNIRSVCINGAYIQFYERLDIENTSSVIFWVLEFIKEH